MGEDDDQSPVPDDQTGQSLTSHGHPEVIDVAAVPAVTPLGGPCAHDQVVRNAKVVALSGCPVHGNVGREPSKKVVEEVSTQSVLQFIHLCGLSPQQPQCDARVPQSE